jgi:penicillin amidase
MSADRPEPAIYTAIRRELCSGLAKAWKLPLPDELVRGVISGAFPAIIAQVRAGDQTVTENWSRSLAEATGRAIEWLTATLGPDEEAWHWGALNHLAFTPAVPTLSLPEGRPVPGDSDTVRMAAAGAQTNVVGGSVARYVFDVGDWENSAWVIPDQFDEWYQVQLVPMYYEWSTIPEGHSTFRRLVPAHAASASARG